MVQSKFPCMRSFSSNDVIDVDESRNFFVFKKFINPAIYVEKTIEKMAQSGFMNYQKHSTDSIRIIKTKRCSCSINRNTCPCHPLIATENGTEKETQVEKFDLNFPKNSESKLLLRSFSSNSPPKLKEQSVNTIQKKISTILPLKSESQFNQKTVSPNNKKTNIETPKLLKETMKSDEKVKNYLKDNSENYENQENISSSSSSTLSGSSRVTIKKSNKIVQDEMKLSLSSLTSFTPSENESIRGWLAKKLEEQKKKQLERRKEEQRKELERLKVLEKERENFKLWLAAKKKKEEEQKIEQERQQQMEHLRKLEKEKRDLENQIKYQIWLKRKEEQNMDKKNQEQLKLLESKIDKERRLLANQKAFQDWLKSSKNKPKPLPFSRGLDSLRSSMSVTYVNPVPWVPNIDHKPASQ